MRLDKEDFNFNVGDILILGEWNPYSQKYILGN